MNFTEFRLKFRRFLRKNRRILFIVFIIWAIIFFIDKIVGNMNNGYVREDTYQPHTAIINNSKKVSSSMQESIDEIIEEYMTYCNDGEFEKAFNMISEECREYEFDNNIEKYMSYLYTKMPTKKLYTIQNYSSAQYGGKTMYIYQIKYTDDFLATGLTGSDYSYTQENIIFYTDDDNELKMNVGNYMYHADIKNISENEYLKLDVVDKVVNYSIEQYQVKITNRSDYTIVISDGKETDEVLLKLPNEVRRPAETMDIVIEPKDTETLTFTFQKFVDDGDISNSIIFSSIRVMEQYSGTENVEDAVIESEIDNAIAKFSMEVSVQE